MDYEPSARGYVAYSAGKYRDAIRYYTVAISYAPYYTNHYVNRSLSYYHLQKYSDALKDAKIAVDLMPNEPKGYICLGAAHSALKQYHNAVAAYNKGLEADPNNEVLESALANVQPLIKAQAAGPTSNEEADDPTATPLPADLLLNTKKEKNDLSNDELLMNSLSAAASDDATNAIQLPILELLLDHQSLNNNNNCCFSIRIALSVLNRMVDDGVIVEGGQLWCVALDLFEDAGKRQVFISMPNDKGRLAWLQHNNNAGGAQGKKVASAS